MRIHPAINGDLIMSAIYPITHPSIHHYPNLTTYPLRSLQVKNSYDPADIVQTYYSDLCVLESQKGFYIGTLFTHPGSKFVEPGSRDSTYFPCLIQAQSALDYLEVLAASGSSKYPFDIPVWEARFTHIFKISVKYRSSI